MERVAVQGFQSEALEGCSREIVAFFCLFCSVKSIGLSILAEFNTPSRGQILSDYQNFIQVSDRLYVLAGNNILVAIALGIGS